MQEHERDRGVAPPPPDDRDRGLRSSGTRKRSPRSAASQNDHGGSNLPLRNRFDASSGLERSNIHVPASGAGALIPQAPVNETMVRWPFPPNAPSMTDTLNSLIFSGWGNGTDLDDVRALIEAGADVNAEVDGNTPLHMAAMVGAFPDRGEAATRLLLAHGADTEKLSACGRSPLHIAVTTLATGTVRALLEGGASPDATCNKGATALHHALHELRKAWAHDDLDQHDGNANTAARFVAENLRILAEFGADFTTPDPSGGTPFRLACTLPGCPEEVLLAVIEGGANVLDDTLTYEDEEIDLLAASMVSELPIPVSVSLLAAGCPFDVAYKPFADRPIVNVVAQYQPDRALALAESHEGFRDALLAARSHTGTNMLGVAAWSGSADLVQYLSKHGQSVTHVNNEGKTVTETIEDAAPEHLHLLDGLS